MHASRKHWVLLGVLWLSACGASDGRSGRCTSKADCASTQGCIDGTCAQLCVSTRQCASGEVCSAGLCQPGDKVYPLCGNGNKDADEQCDDGNRNDADGCSSSCSWEAPGPFDLGGSVAGLEGVGLILQNEGGDDLAISANGTFHFVEPLAHEQPYEVSVKVQPTAPTQICNVANGSGSAYAADITNVEVTCAAPIRYSIGGTVSGLVGAGLRLTDNGADVFAVSTNGSFAFPTPLGGGVKYAVAVEQQPTSPGQTCVVSNATGTVPDAEVTNVIVTCTTHTFAVGGAVSGLAGSGLVLQNSGGDDLPITSEGLFTFASLVPDGDQYSVTVKSNPTTPNQVCIVNHATGTIAGNDIVDVEVVCSTKTYTIGGTITGLGGSDVVLENNLGDGLPFSNDGPFQFTTPIADLGTYDVTVRLGINAQLACSVANGSGTVNGANVTDISITCVAVYPVGGTVSGLAGSGLVLQNNGGDDLPISANGSFTFPTMVADQGSYLVTVKDNPLLLSQTCIVGQGTGPVSGAAIADVQVTCTTDAPPIANAGTYALQSNGTGVPLDASATSYGGRDILTYTWLELSSFGVTFNNNGAQSPTTVTMNAATVFPSDATLTADIVVQLSVSDGFRVSTDQATIPLYRGDFAYVAPAGAGDGSAPNSPSGDINSALAFASTNGRTGVAVQEGTYTIAASDPNIVLPTGVSLWGGYDASWVRDPSAHTSTIADNRYVSGGAGGDGTGAVEIPFSAGPVAFSGFRIKVGTAPFMSGVVSRGSATITQNTILATTAGSSSPYGVYCGCNGSIAKNSIESLGAALTISGNSAAPQVENNVMIGKGRVVEVLWTGASPVTLRNNTLIGQTNTSGITIYGLSPTPPTNVVVQNNIFDLQGGNYCLEESNDVSDFAVVANNDLFNCPTVILSEGNSPLTTVVDLEGLGDMTASGNVRVDPGFDGNYGLAAALCSVNVAQGGLDGSTQGWPFSSDIDGIDRSNLLVGPNDSPSNAGAGGWSMGAFEFDGTCANP